MSELYANLEILSKMANLIITYLGSPISELDGRKIWVASLANKENLDVKAPKNHVMCIASTRPKK